MLSSRQHLRFSSVNTSHTSGILEYLALNQQDAGPAYLPNNAQFYVLTSTFDSEVLDIMVVLYCKLQAASELILFSQQDYTIQTGSNFYCSQRNKTGFNKQMEPTSLESSYIEQRLRLQLTEVLDN